MVDDFPIVRAGLHHLFDQHPELEICGEAATSADARSRLPPSDPDLLVIEPGLPDGEGLSLLAAARATYPELPILAYSRLPESPYAERAVRAGAQGFVGKGESLDALLEAVRRVLRGGVHLRAEVVALATRERTASGVAALSDRELEVFRLLGEGRSSREIAGRLGISIKTVGTHRANAMRKLGIRTAAQLIHRAIEWSGTGPRDVEPAV